MHHTIDLAKMCRIYDAVDKRLGWDSLRSINGDSFHKIMLCLNLQISPLFHLILVGKEIVFFRIVILDQAKTFEIYTNLYLKKSESATDL